MLAGDAVDAAACDEAVMQVIDTWGRIDVLINNAGIAGDSHAFTRTAVDDWWRVLEVNVKGPLQFMARVLPSMLQQDSGIVINIGSYAAIRPIPGNSAYTASKAALARLTDSVAEEVKASGVQLFCVSPGLVETDMTRGKAAFEHVPAEAWSQPEDICKTTLRLIEGDCQALSGRFLHVLDNIDRLLDHAQMIGDEGLFQLQLSGLDGVIR
jgi:NADP-dependent 3-hydroxy acid dehydrogenase YdfG